MLVEYSRASDFILYVFLMIKGDLLWKCAFGEKY